MTEAQFTALAQLLRLRAGPARQAVRLHLVQGLSVPDAARAAGVDYQLALKAVYRVNAGLALTKQASGPV
jgi:DNA-directed RNA polymerase specialized sigma24 family protein